MMVSKAMEPVTRIFFIFALFSCSRWERCRARNPRRARPARRDTPAPAPRRLLDDAKEQPQPERPARRLRLLGEEGRQHLFLGRVAAARIEQPELRRGLERELALRVVLDQAGHAVEDGGALAAAHVAAPRCKLLALHAKRRTADRAARGEAQWRTPVTSAQPSSRRRGSRSNQGR